MTISDALRQRVIEDANYRCAYCKAPSLLTGTPLIMEHTLPKSLGGADDRENLVAACYRCNEFKGARIEALDSETQKMAPLFNPWRHFWSEHFVWENGGTHLRGLRSIGRATVVALRLNNDYAVRARMIWIEFSWHPPNQ
jgi:HNH endonuclease